MKNRKLPQIAMKFMGLLLMQHSFVIALSASEGIATEGTGKEEVIKPLFAPAVFGGGAATGGGAVGRTSSCPTPPTTASGMPRHSPALLRAASDSLPHAAAGGAGGGVEISVSRSSSAPISSGGKKEEKEKFSFSELEKASSIEEFSSLNLAAYKEVTNSFFLGEYKVSFFICAGTLYATFEKSPAWKKMSEEQKENYFSLFKDSIDTGLSAFFFLSAPIDELMRGKISALNKNSEIPDDVKEIISEISKEIISKIK